MNLNRRVLMKFDYCVGSNCSCYREHLERVQQPCSPLDFEALVVILGCQTPFGGNRFASRMPNPTLKSNRSQNCCGC